MLENEFSGLDFSDKRLNNRFSSILQKVRVRSMCSFSGMADSRSWIKGLYRFFSNSKITRENILEAHINNTVERCKKTSVVLAVQDTTVVSFKNFEQIEGLGYIDDIPKKRGFLIHNVLLLDGCTGKPLGLSNQQVIVRDKIHSKKETSRNRLKRKRESEKWFIGLQKVNEQLKGHKKIIHVADRESDIYFFIKAIKETKGSYVIRSSYNRSTLEGPLFEAAKKGTFKGKNEIKIPQKGGRKARTATVKIYCRTLNILPPKITDRKKPTLQVNVVYIKEIKQKNGIEWMLLTGEPVKTIEECKKVVWYYKNRWQIEDFHKGLKSGCKIEERRLETIDQHKKLLSMFSVLAWNGLVLRFNARIPENKEIELSEIKKQILKKKFPKYKEGNMNSNDVLRLIAMLGNYIGRKNDGPPGWQSIMMGLSVLEFLEEGVKIAGGDICG